MVIVLFYNTIFITTSGISNLPHLAIVYQQKSLNDSVTYILKEKCSGNMHGFCLAAMKLCIATDILKISQMSISQYYS